MGKSSLSKPWKEGSVTIENNIKIVEKALRFSITQISVIMDHTVVQTYIWHYFSQYWVPAYVWVYDTLCLSEFLSQFSDSTIG